MTSEMPDDGMLDDSIARVERRLMPVIARSNRRTRRKRIAATAGAGITLFAVGLAVGAAVLAPIYHPSYPQGVSIGSDGQVIPVIFTIECHESLSSTQIPSTTQYSAEAPTRTAAARMDPASVCESMRETSTTLSAVSAEIEVLRSQGMRCGYISDGSHKWNFDAPSTAAGTPVSFSDGPPVIPPSAECLTEVTLPPAAVVPLQASAVCEVGPDWAAVFPRAKASTSADVCSKMGYSVWNPA